MRPSASASPWAASSSVPVSPGLSGRRAARPALRRCVPRVPGGNHRAQQLFAYGGGGVVKRGGKGFVGDAEARSEQRPAGPGRGRASPGPRAARRPTRRPRPQRPRRRRARARRDRADRARPAATATPHDSSPRPARQVHACGADTGVGRARPGGGPCRAGGCGPCGILPAEKRGAVLNSRAVRNNGPVIDGPSPGAVPKLIVTAGVLSPEHDEGEGAGRLESNQRVPVLETGASASALRPRPCRRS